MRVDQAGEDEGAGGVEDGNIVSGGRGTEAFDDPSADQNVPLLYDPVGSDRLAAADEQVGSHSPTYNTEPAKGFESLTSDAPEMRVHQLQTPSGHPVYAAEDGGKLLALEDPAASPREAVPPSEVPGSAAHLGDVASAAVIAPVRPSKIIAIGLNYRDHIDETGMDEPARPLIFAKFPSSLVGPGAEIVIEESITQRVDWEVELGVVVGDRMRDVPEAKALDHVYGYTVGNDVSARDVQFADVQWVRGKSLDTFCPVGPVVVTRDEVPDPQALTLQTRVNGEVVQDSSTDLMLFGVAELLAFCSRSFTLDPGDLLLTGTPWGCGEFMDPKRSLAPGDLVETEIGGIGVLSNPVVAGGAT